MVTVRTRARNPAVLVATDLVVFCRHLDLVHEVRTRGLEPIVVFGPDTPADELARRCADPGHPMHDVPLVRHVPDYSLATLLETTIELLDHVDLEAVLNCGELFVEAVGALAEVLHLPGTGGQAARIARNKLLQRLAVPILAPEWALVGTRRTVTPEQWSLYPAVLKPVGRMSSSGVRAVSTAAELASALGHYPDGETLLIEEQTSGPEFSVESLVHCGEIVWAEVTEKRTNEDTTQYFTETGHTSPAVGLTAEQHSVLIEANRMLLASIGFASGMSHAEFRITGERAVLMEVAARPPGDAITKLWQLASGNALEPALVDLALGMRPKPLVSHRRAQQLYLDHKQGRLRDVRCSRGPAYWITDEGAWPTFTSTTADDPARLCAVVVTRCRGDLLGEPADSGGRSVSIVVDCPLDSDVAEVAAHFARSVEIDVVAETEEAATT